ncbi:MAG: hypothetical protein IJ722_00695 [Alloprevotella sp.]|nr:hypothetical protein [Alloprevotella sp.]
MKKTLFALAALALSLAACSGNGTEGTKYMTYGGVTSQSGDFCFVFDEANNVDSIPLNVNVKGDSAEISMDVTLFRTEKEVKEGAELKPFWATIHGRDEQKDIEVRLDADPASVEQFRAILDKPGDSVVVTFKGTMLKADLDSINNKKVWTSLLM